MKTDPAPHEPCSTVLPYTNLAWGWGVASCWVRKNWAEISVRKFYFLVNSYDFTVLKNVGLEWSPGFPLCVCVLLILELTHIFKNLTVPQISIGGKLSMFLFCISEHDSTKELFNPILLTSALRHGAVSH